MPLSRQVELERLDSLGGGPGLDLLVVIVLIKHIYGHIWALITNYCPNMGINISDNVTY